MQNDRNVEISPDGEQAARSLLERLHATVGEREKISIALSGGNTPAALFALWKKEYLTRTPWERISFFWVDERCVPPGDAQSNYGLARKLLLNSLPPDTAKIYPINGEAEAESEAVRYSDLVKNLLHIENGSPVFDFVLLGIGDDGHTSSVFPGLERLLACPEPYAAATNPYNGTRRVCMTGVPMIAALNTFFLVTGKAKQDITRRVLQKENAALYPASWVWHRAQNPRLFAAF